MQRRRKPSLSTNICFEGLENRLLLSSTLQIVDSMQLIPTTDPPPAYHDFQFPANGITRLNPNGTTTQFQLTPGDTPGQIAYDSHNNLWFTNDEQNQIDSISSSGQVTRYTLPDPSFSINNIVVASDDSIWFTESTYPGNPENATSLVVRLTSDGQLTDFALGESQTAGPLVASTNGAVWVGVGNGSVLRLSPDGTYSQIDHLPAYNAAWAPGVNGTVWYGGNLTDSSGLTTVELLSPDGQVAAASYGGELQGWLVGMPDGGAALISYDHITHFEPDGSSSATTLQTSDPFYGAPAFDNQDNLWIGTNDGLKQISPEGQSTLFSIPHPKVSPSIDVVQIAPASDGSVAILWEFGGADGDPNPGFNTLSALVQPEADGSFSGTVGRFTYNRGRDSASDYTVTIDWGDGQSSTGTVVDPYSTSNSGIYVVTGTHTYQQPGVYTTTIIPSIISQTPPISPPIVPLPPVDPPVSSPIDSPVLFPIESPIQPPITEGPPGVIYHGPVTVFINPQPPQIDSFYTTPLVTTTSNIAGTSYSAVVQGRYNGAANSSFIIQFYGLTASDLNLSNPDLSSLSLLGSTIVTTDSTGNAAFLASFTTPDNSDIAVEATVTDSSGNTSPFSTRVTQAAVTPSTANQSLVAAMYIQLLNRNVDPVGFAYWTHQLNSGVNPADVAADIQHSMEYRNKVVQGLYQQLLHRDADTEGLNTFSQLLLANGGNAEQVASVIVGSPEYFQARAGGTIGGLLNAIYHDVLGRSVDPTGQTFFNDQFSHGATTQAVAQMMYSSAEYDGNLIDGYYNTYLDRNADSAGTAYWTGQLSAGQSSAQVMAGFLGSAEFSANGFYNGDQRLAIVQYGNWHGLAIAHEYTVMTRNNADFTTVAATLNLPVSHVQSLGNESSFSFDTTAAPATVYSWLGGTLATAVWSIDPNYVSHAASPLALS